MQFETYIIDSVHISVFYHNLHLSRQWSTFPMARQSWSLRSTLWEQIQIDHIPVWVSCLHETHIEHFCAWTSCTKSEKN